MNLHHKSESQNNDIFWKKPITVVEENISSVLEENVQKTSTTLIFYFLHSKINYTKFYYLNICIKLSFF